MAMDEIDGTLRELLKAGADDTPAVLSVDGSIFTYGELRADIDRLGDRLRSFGLGAEDRIALVMPNGPEMAVSFLAAATTGCAAPLNPKYRPNELRFYLNDLGVAALIIGDDDSGMAARTAAASADSPPLVLQLSGICRPGQLELSAAASADQACVENDKTNVASAHGVVSDGVASESVECDRSVSDGAVTNRLSVTQTSADHGVVNGPLARSAGRPCPEDVALVLHTSGTTSRPKIVPLRQKNLACSAVGVAESLQLNTADRSLNVMPLFHIHGLVAGLLAPLAAGGSVVCTPGFDAFSFFGWLGSLQPTYYTAVPTMHQMVLSRSKRHRDQARAAGLRFARSSSAALPATVSADLAELFDAPVIEAYGMTEATHQMCANPLPPAVAKPTSAGIPTTGIELAVLGSDDQKLLSGQKGEVAIKGPSVIDGYENNPVADAAAFTDGWFRTGDEGYIDSDGYLYLTGRLKEQINRGGEKVSPLEVDEVLLRHPAVAQAVTFAVPHNKLGEDVAAAIVLESGATANEMEVRQFLTESLAAFKVPRRVLFLNELPKGPTGKLQRIGLAARLGLTS